LLERAGDVLLRELDRVIRFIAASCPALRLVEAGAYSSFGVASISGGTSVDMSACKWSSRVNADGKREVA
jgi:hypothetical protein